MRSISRDVGETGRFPLTIALLLGCFVLFSSGCQRGGTLTDTEVDLLGTVCTITLYGGGAESDLDAAFERIRAIDRIMTVAGVDSEVIRVNEAAGTRPVKVSADTFEVIKEGLEFSRLGNGAFDITVGPLVKLWGIGTERAGVPSTAEIRDALAKVGYGSLALSDADSSVFLKKPGMAIDLGAIAKGYAADEAARVLAGRGIAHALIDLGGNILTVGVKPDGSRWRIGIQDPEKPRGEYIGILEAAETSVVTSGVYERYFESGGVRYHHILDTTSGFPVRNGLLAVCIVTPRSIIADGYSTLIFTLGLEKGRRMVEKTHGAVEALFITDAQEVYLTPGIKDSFHISDTRYAVKGW